jgi:hypothetical protein
MVLKVLSNEKIKNYIAISLIMGVSWKARHIYKDTLSRPVLVRILAFTISDFFNETSFLNVPNKSR